MASSASALSLLLTLSLLSLASTSVPEDELSAALTALRNHGGYSLFANAVATSDLYFTLLSLSSFTLLAPPDRSVYSLDFTSSSSDDYLSSLCLHVVPRRLSLLSLRSSSPSGLDLPTLDNSLSLHVQTRLGSAVVSVSGVDVTSPGIFYGRSVAVHGLGGSVVPRHRPPTPPDFSDRTVSNPSEAVSPVVPRHRAPTQPDFSDRTVSDHSEAVSPVVPHHRPHPPPDFSDRTVSDPSEAVSPMVPRHRPPTPPDFSDSTVSDHSEAVSPVVPRHRPHSPPDFSDRTVSGPSEAVSPVVPRHQTRPQPDLSDRSVSDPSEAVLPAPPDFSDRSVSDPSEAVSPVVPRHQTHPQPDFSDRSVSDHLVTDSPENSDSQLVPRRQSSDPSQAVSPENSDSPIVPRRKTHLPPDFLDRTVSDHLVADSPEISDYSVEIGQVEVSPASLIGPIGVSPASLDTSPAYVEDSVKKETVRGESDEMEPMLTYEGYL